MNFVVPDDSQATLCDPDQVNILTNDRPQPAITVKIAFTGHRHYLAEILKDFYILHLITRSVARFLTGGASTTGTDIAARGCGAFDPSGLSTSFADWIVISSGSMNPTKIGRAINGALIPVIRIGAVKRFPVNIWYAM